MAHLGMPARFQMQRSRCGGSAVGPAAALGRVALLCIAAPGAAHAQAPLTYLSAFGKRAYPVQALLWGVIAISLAVIVMSIVLVLWGTFRGPRLPGSAMPGRIDVGPARGGLIWIVAGVGVTTLVLFGTVVWTVVTLAAVAAPPGGKPDLAITIIGHQWWWEVVYGSDTPSQVLRTANEIHVPVGRSVSASLETSDVIHSFWVPSLTGKTDVIPGQTNQTWFEASRPGIYRGQCGEYCGQQHAHMGFEVIADAPDAFAAWRQRQLEPATPPSSEQGRQDQQAFVQKCGACHTVRGTQAGGVLGPDLTHLMGRSTLAAATLPNTAGYLSGWIADPQHVKPGAMMPRLDISGPQLERIRRFLETLK